MPQDPRTHYQVLGLERGCAPGDIERAWRNFRSEMQQETAAPDPRRALLMEKAYEVLSDPALREAYDESLRSAAAILARARTSEKRKLAAIGAAVAAVGAAGYFALRPAPPQQKPRDPKEIAAAAALAVGRVEAVDIAGSRAPLGLAFAVGEGALAASCHGLTPASEIVVSFAQRSVPARVTTVFGQPAVCRLAADGTGSWPLPLSRTLARAHQKVYATKVTPDGRVALVEGEVRRVFGENGITQMDVIGPAASQAAGGPLLDDQGQVLGIAAGGGRYTQVPVAWIEEGHSPRPVEAAPPPPAQP